LIKSFKKKGCNSFCFQFSTDNHVSHEIQRSQDIENNNNDYSINGMINLPLYQKRSLFNQKE